MKFPRLAISALLCGFFVSALAQPYPLSWSTFRDLSQHGTETAVKELNAPGGGFYVYGDLAGSSQVVAKLNASGATLWSRCVEGTANDMAANGTGVVVVGQAPRTGLGRLMCVAKYDPSGALLWARNISGGTSGGFIRIKIAMDAAGNAFVGANVLGVDANVSLTKLSAIDGSVQFSKIIGDGDAGTEQVTAVATDSLGSAFIAGTSPTGIFFNKYDASGNLKWSKTPAGFYPDVLVDASGNSYLVQTATINAVNSLLVTKFDPNGNVLWSPSTPISAYLWGCALTPSGAVVVSSAGFNVTKFSSSGVFQWTVTNANYKNVTTGLGQICADAADNVYVSGATNAIPSHAALAKFTTAGVFDWGKTEVGSANLDQHDEGRSVVVDPSGHVVWLSRLANVAPTYADFHIDSFDNTGNQTWGVNFDAGKTSDRAEGSVTDASGNTYVVCSSMTFEGFNTPTYGILKFHSTGPLIWSHGIGSVGGAAPGFFPPQLAPGGGVVLLQRSPVSGGIHATVYRYDVNGNLLWTYSSFPGHVFIGDYKVGSDGSVYLGMQVSTDNGLGGFNTTIRVMKLNSNGTLAWISDKPTDTSDSVEAIALDANGNAYVSYSKPVPMTSNDQASLTKVLSNGTYDWSIDVGVPYEPLSLGGGLAVDPAGNVVDIAVDSNGTTFTAYKYDSAGNPSYATPLFTGRTTFGPFTATVDSLGNLFTFASAATDTVAEWLVTRINPNGSVAWTSSVPISGGTLGGGVIPDNLGGATFSGSTRTGNGLDYQTTKFAPNGQRAWPASGGGFNNGTLTYDAGGADNRITGSGTDAAGNIYVTGSGFGPSGTQDINVIRYSAADSLFVNQFESSSMAAGQTYQAAVTFRNTGFDTWTNAGGYRMITLNSSTWGFGSALLTNSEKIAPGQTKTFYFYVYAPTVAGNYALQCKMYRNGFGSFGATSSASIAVVVRPNAARNVSVTAPTSVKAGTTFSVTVDMRNVGTNTWTMAGGYALAPTTGFPAWGVATVPLLAGDSIGTNGHKVFTFNCTAPSSPGSLKMSWQMKMGATFFGDQSIPKTITVTP